jgi:Flp pilus assembly pilin Flp
MPPPILHLAVRAHTTALDATDHGTAGVAPRPARDRGQATTEYALIMLAAALVALLVVAWATAGGGAGKIGTLFDRVIDSVLDRV